MRKYFLQEFDPESVEKGNVSMNEVNSYKFQEYTTNQNGTFIVNNKENLEFKRNFIPLSVSRPNNASVKEIIDCNFKEFKKGSGQLTSNEFNQSTVNGLTAANADLITENITLKRTLKAFMAGISPNNVSNMMFIGAELSTLSGKTKLLSWNKKALAELDADGVFRIKTGEFDTDGNSISGRNPSISSFGETIPVDTINGLERNYYLLFGAGRSIGDTRPGYIQLIGGYGPGPLTGTQITWSIGFSLLNDPKVPPRLILDDSGTLAVIDNGEVIWSSYGQ